MPWSIKIPSNARGDSGRGVEIVYIVVKDPETNKLYRAIDPAVVGGEKTYPDHFEVVDRWPIHPKYSSLKRWIMKEEE